MTRRLHRYQLPSYDGPFKYGEGTKLSRFIVYGLTDPDSGAIRYIGRSSQGLDRPLVHHQRLDGPSTHRTNWIRKLLRAGKIYGVRVLEECAGFGQVVSAEIRWIAKGRRLGWPLTNLTEGGEGAARDQVSIPEDEVARRYAAGESILALSRHYGVSRDAIDLRLRRMGIAIRTGSEANQIRMQQASAEERAAITKAARAARSGKR